MMYDLDQLCSEHEKETKDILSFTNPNDYRSLDILFHYTPSDGLMNIVKNGGTAQLWFTQYDRLNDCNERKEFFDFLHRYCDINVNDKNFSQEYSDRIKSIVASDIAFVTMDIESNHISYVNSDCHIYLCCFSKAPDSLAMWKYYTKSKNYQGYCVGFFPQEFRWMNNIGNGYDIILKEVVYSDEDKRKLLDKILFPLAKIFNNSSAEKKNVIIEFLATELQEYQLVFKNSCFDYEKEVRAILRIPKGVTHTSPKISERKVRFSDGFEKPYVEYNVAPNMIYSVTLPPMSEEEKMKSLKDLLVERGHNNVHIFRSAASIRF